MQVKRETNTKTKTHKIETSTLESGVGKGMLRQLGHINLVVQWSLIIIQPRRDSSPESTSPKPLPCFPLQPPSCTTLLSWHTRPHITNTSPSDPSHHPIRKGTTQHKRRELEASHRLLICWSYKKDSNFVAPIIIIITKWINKLPEVPEHKNWKRPLKIKIK